MSKVIAGSRKNEDFPLMSLEELYEYLINEDISITRPKDMPCEEFLGCLFNIFYHRKGVLFIQRRRRTKEEKERTQVTLNDTMGTLLDAGEDGFDRVLVFATHYRVDGEIRMAEAMECECMITVEDFEQNAFEKDDIRKEFIRAVSGRSIE